MKIFIVLIAVVAVASANTIHRSSGSRSSIYTPPQPATILDLAAAAAAAANGQASASQAVVETAAGNVDGPAYLESLSEVFTSVSQDEVISQLAVADKPSGDTFTLNDVGVENVAVGLDTLEANLGGSIAAAVINDAQSQASGEGALAADESSLNAVSGNKKLNV